MQEAADASRRRDGEKNAPQPILSLTKRANFDKWKLTFDGEGAVSLHETDRFRRTALPRERKAVPAESPDGVGRSRVGGRRRR